MRNQPRPKHNQQKSRDDGESTIKDKEKPEDQKEKPRDQEKSSRERWTRDQRIQAGLLLVGIIYSVVTYLLLQTTKEGIHSGQRAYLVIEKLKLDEAPTAGKSARLNYDIRNTGQTALNVHVSALLDVFVGDPPPASALPQTPQTNDIGAADPLHATTVRVAPLRPDEVEDITREIFSLEGGGKLFKMELRGRRLIAYGLIRYTDVFGGHDETEFCSVYLPESMHLHAPDGEKAFGQCTTPTRNRMK